MRRTSRIAFAGILFLGLCAQAGAAGLFRAYLSSTGDDAFPCTRPLPCRLLPAALNAVADGGEIWMLDSANYNTVTGVTIAKSVTILAVPGEVGSLVAVGGINAVTVSGSGVKVTLHNIVITNLPGNLTGDGAIVSGGASLSIEDSQIYGLPGNGVSTFTGNLAVSNTVIRDNTQLGVLVTSTSTNATLDRLQIARNAQGGVQFITGASGTLSNSVLDANGTTGVFVGAAGSTQSTKVVVRDCVIRGHTNGVWAQGNGANASAKTTVSHSTLSQNVVGIETESQSGNTGILLVADGNVVTYGSIGFNIGANTYFYSPANNVVLFTTVADVQGTPQAPIPYH